MNNLLTFEVVRKHDGAIMRLLEHPRAELGNCVERVRCRDVFHNLKLLCNSLKFSEDILKLAYLFHTDEVGFVLQDVAILVLTDHRLLSRLDVKVDER